MTSTQGTWPVASIASLKAHTTAPPEKGSNGSLLYIGGSPELWVPLHSWCGMAGVAFRVAVPSTRDVDPVPPACVAPRRRGPGRAREKLGTDRVSRPRTRARSPGPASPVLLVAPVLGPGGRVSCPKLRATSCFQHVQASCGPDRHKRNRRPLRSHSPALPRACPHNTTATSRPPHARGYTFYRPRDACPRSTS